MLDRDKSNIGQRAVVGRGRDQEKKLNFKQALAAFYDYEKRAVGSIPAYLPTIISNIGFSTTQAEGLSANHISHLAHSLCFRLLATTGSSIGFFAALGGIGYAILAVVGGNAVRFFATFLICAGVFTAVSLALTWVTDNQGS
ncbi:hypothetical protein N7499_009036 [Penicillium canescens]|nr:hypothetical protein N7499_009036 [Penicillium canescens]KAJ6159366.1 hypothetical protein N7485_012192 [Penicillium canescens]